MSWFEDLSHLTGKSLMGHDHCVLQVIPRLDVVVEVCVSVKMGGSSLDAKVSKCPANELEVGHFAAQ